MKGIILAAASGTSLHPLTLGLPKQLLPIYDKPMVYYPLQTLVQSGVKDILIITSKEDQSLFQRALGSGESFGVHLSYAFQERPEGIAQAIMIGQDFIGNDAVCLVTGDTIIIGDSLQRDLAKAYKAAEKSRNATIFVNRDYDPKQYGIVVLGGKGDTPMIAGVSDKMYYYSITGLYVFPNSVLKHIFEIEKSERQRYEITSVSQIFNQQNKLRIQKLSSDCIWFDTNTFDSIMNCSLHIQKLC